MNTHSFNPAIFLSLCAAIAAVGQDQPNYTEFRPPAGSTEFASDFGGLPDVTGDGVGEFYVNSSIRADVYDGESLKLLYSMRSPCNGSVGGIQAAGDLTGDGIQDLMGGNACVLGGQVSFFNGATGQILYTVGSPNPVRLGLFGGAATRLLPDLTGDGKDDWLIHQPEFESQVGRVYIFNSQTRAVHRIIQNTGTGFTFHMRNVEVIPDVDRDGKPDLLVGANGASVHRDGQTLSNAGRVIVRSLETGAALYELHEPEPTAGGGFGLVLKGIGDITSDGIGDIAVGTHFKDINTGAIYLFSGADGQWLRTLRSPSFLTVGGGRFGRGIEVLPDLNGDGVPELWTYEDALRLSYVLDGATSALLQTIESPEPLGTAFYIGAVHQTAVPGIRAYLFGWQFAGGTGRVYYMPFTPLQPTRLRAMGRTATGFRLQVTGEPGLILEIHASSDLKTWERIGVTTTGTEPVEVEDSFAASQPHRFYRAVQRE